MADLFADLLSPLQALLFSRSDFLHLDQVDNLADLTVSSDGITTTLSSAGVALMLPMTSLSQASLQGNVVLPDGTHVVLGSTGSDIVSVQLDAAATYGLDGNDQITDGAGNDYVYGGSGSDTIDGGAGNDHLYGYGPTAGIDGADTINGGGGGDYIQGNAGDDVLSGDDGDDRILGGSGNDTIHGADGNDSINGNFGSDTIDGGNGNDTLRGGKDDDTITGGAGNDDIWGDLGSDTLTGGAGADTFHFSGSSAATISLSGLLGGVDKITDFTVGEDRIDLGFTPSQVLHATAGSLQDALADAASALTGSTTGTVEAVAVGNDTVLFFGAAGGGVSDSAVQLVGVSAATITASAFA